MADDERLRETLLELQILRDREASMLAETRRLAACLEAFSTSENPNAALNALFATIVQTTEATHILLLEKATDGSTLIVASNRTDWEGKQLLAPIDLHSRPRNVTDHRLLGTWQADVDLGRLGGLLVAPASANYSFMAFGDEGMRFGSTDLELIRRLSGLALQGYRNAKIARENNLLAAAIAGSSSGFSISDATFPDNPLVYVNAAFEELSGYKAPDVLGENCRFLSAEQEDSDERSRLRNAVRDRTSGTFLLRNKRKDQTPFWNELTLFPVKNDLGDVVNLVATQTDVTERIEATAERDRVTARMEQSLASSDDAFILLEQDGQIAFANDTTRVFFPAPDHDWKAGTRFADNWEAYLGHISALERPIVDALRTLDLTASSEMTSGREIELPDGRSILLKARALNDGGTVASANDITAQRHAQNLLSQRLAAIEAAKDGILICDDNSRITYVNKAGAKLMDFETPGEALGQKWTKHYRAAPNVTSTNDFEVTLVRHGDSIDQSHEISGSPLPNGGYVIVLRDITESLALETREAEMSVELIKLQRREAVAQLTAGIAHDFNNLLSVINGSVALVSLADNIPHDLAEHIKRIGQAGQQSSKLVTQLLNAGNPLNDGDGFELKQVIEQLPDLMLPKIPPNITLSVPETIPAKQLKGDRDVLSQILMNLTLNAVHAIADRDGQITIHCDTSTDAQQSAFDETNHFDKKALHVRLTVTDNGSGMEPETLKKAKTPFFTTKGRHGSGLGLAMASMQIQSYGGAIKLHSTIGVGTEVELFWPLIEADNSPRALENDEAIDLTGKTVIVVDDDANVGAVLAAYLEAQGAEVAICEDPRDALSAVTEDPAGWSALVTDYDMPIMNGGALAQETRQAAPNLPIFMVSALADRLNDPRISQANVTEIFPKPVPLKKLSAAIKAATRFV
ncbi:MAG: PAS domain-containing protein [Pseudomonadota bacterium]